MKLEDVFKYLVGAYYGVEEMDEYPLKEFVLNRIENYIKDFIKTSPIKGYDYKANAEKFRKELSLKTKLQDSLLVLRQLDESMELILLIKAKIREIK